MNTREEHLIIEIFNNVHTTGKNQIVLFTFCKMILHVMTKKAKQGKCCCLKMLYVSVPGCSSLSLKGRPRKRKGMDGKGSDQQNHNHLSESWMERMKVCCGVCNSVWSIDMFMNTNLMAKQDVLIFLNKLWILWCHWVLPVLF